MNKKGVFDQLSGLAIGAVALGITLVVVFLILAQLAVNTQVVADANATAAVATVQTSTDDIPTWIPIIIVTFIGVLLIGLVTAFRRQGR